MNNQDWLVTDTGNCLSCPSPRQWDLLIEGNEYRLYRFLTDVEDVLKLAEEKEENEIYFLAKLRRLVRKFLIKCDWISNEIPQADSETGTSVRILYNEPGYVITIQTEVMLPGTFTPIHNHGTWAVVAILKGQAKNTFWRRFPTELFPDKIELAGEKILLAGEIVSFTTEAIHAVEALGDEPMVTLNLYGDTHFDRRFVFDTMTHQAKHLWSTQK